MPFFLLRAKVCDISEKLDESSCFFLELEQVLSLDDSLHFLHEHELSSDLVQVVSELDELEQVVSELDELLSHESLHFLQEHELSDDLVQVSEELSQPLSQLLSQLLSLDELLQLVDSVHDELSELSELSPPQSFGKQ